LETKPSRPAADVGQTLRSVIGSLGSFADVGQAADYTAFAVAVTGAGANSRPR